MSIKGCFNTLTCRGNAHDGNSLRRKLQRHQTDDEGLSNEIERLAQQFENSVETGFQLATARGPLCAEPVEGMAYFVENLEFDAAVAESEQCRRPLT